MVFSFALQILPLPELIENESLCWSSATSSSSSYLTHSGYSRRCSKASSVVRGRKNLVSPNPTCSICGRQFHGSRSKRNLHRHMMLHRNDKPYTCPYCEYRSNQKHNLKLHIRSAHAGHFVTAMHQDVS